LVVNLHKTAISFEDVQKKSCRMIWNRDVNAAINLVTIGKSLIINGVKPILFSIRLSNKQESDSSEDTLCRGVSSTV
jgi:transposase